MIPTNPNDREYFYGKDGNVYQVIGYVHPNELIYCLQKYNKIEEKKRSIEQYVWRSHITGEYYERNIPTYSSKTASNIITHHKYRTFSEVYGVNFISFPKTEILYYLEPKKKLDQLRNQVRTNFASLTDQERLAIELSFLFEEELGINSENLGVTGSILWGAVHENSDIDVIIYGIQNMQRFFRGVSELVRSGNQLRLPLLTEQMNWAGKFAQKSGMSLEDCTISITKKKFLLFFSKFYLSLAFNPTEEEIHQNTLSTKKTQFVNVPELTTVTIRARVTSDLWMYFYPGIVYLDNIRILKPPESQIDIPLICRVVIFEHENIGYYEQGSEIEIRGLVQIIKNPPYDVIAKSQRNDNSNKVYGQIIVGTSENYGNEYVKNLEI